MNIKKQYSIRDFGTPSVFSGTNILTLRKIDNKKYWYINGIATNIDTTVIPEQQDGTLAFFNGETVPGGTPSARNVDNYVFQWNLELLNQRLNAIHKELTYWDLYKLTASVDNAEDLESTFSGLSIGQSMVINCPTFSVGGIQYSRGDVIVKTSDNEEIQIKALSTGLFYPYKLSKIEGSNIYTLQYNYYGGQPVDENASENIKTQRIDVGESVNTSNGLPRNIIISGFEDQPGNIYGEFFDGIATPATFPAIHEGGVSSAPVIRPIVKVFSEDHEEISLDSRSLHIELVTSATPDYWRVTVESDVTIAHFIQVK